MRNHNLLLTAALLLLSPSSIDAFASMTRPIALSKTAIRAEVGDMPAAEIPNLPASVAPDVSAAAPQVAVPAPVVAAPATTAAVPQVAVPAPDVIAPATTAAAPQVAVPAPDVIAPATTAAAPQVAAPVPDFAAPATTAAAPQVAAPVSAFTSPVPAYTAPTTNAASSTYPGAKIITSEQFAPPTAIKQLIDPDGEQPLPQYPELDLDTIALVIGQENYGFAVVLLGEAIWSFSKAPSIDHGLKTLLPAIIAAGVLGVVSGPMVTSGDAGSMSTGLFIATGVSLLMGLCYAARLSAPFSPSPKEIPALGMLVVFLALFSFSQNLIVDGFVTLPSLPTVDLPFPSLPPLPYSESVPSTPPATSVPSVPSLPSLPSLPSFPSIKLPF